MTDAGQSNFLYIIGNHNSYMIIVHESKLKMTV